jgi:hypothetical protein
VIVLRIIAGILVALGLLVGAAWWLVAGED